MRSLRSFSLSPWAAEKSAKYHCISRVVDKKFVLYRAEKEKFVEFMRLYEEFCGVKVVSYCVMTNHFHLLIEVPPRPEGEMGDEEFIERLAKVYSSFYVEQISTWLATARKGNAQDEVTRLKEKFLYRMWDLSEFMKVLKQRFTQWFNKKHKRKGTLWESRFKSVLVQDGHAARVMAAYIDLNPMRAGMVKDPKSYRWCGYGEAVAGSEKAREGIARVLESNEGDSGALPESLTLLERMEQYRVLLFEDGECIESDPRAPSTIRRASFLKKGMTPKQVEKVIESGGKLTQSQMLRCRIRYFTDGMVIGSKAFVDDFFVKNRQAFSEGRKSGARKFRNVADQELHSIRDLQRKPVG